LNLGLRNLGLYKKGIKNKIPIEAPIQTTPPNLSGIARKIA
jgi:hypothetical protein